MNFFPCSDFVEGNETKVKKNGRKIHSYVNHVWKPRHCGQASSHGFQYVVDSRFWLQLQGNHASQKQICYKEKKHVPIEKKKNKDCSHIHLWHQRIFFFWKAAPKDLRNRTEKLSLGKRNTPLPEEQQQQQRCMVSRPTIGRPHGWWCTPEGS